jgi:chorismate mutase/prephenate dehydratase
MDNDLQDKLKPLRGRIDTLDAQILDLLSQRGRLAQEVGELKLAVQADGPVVCRDREVQVIRRLQQQNGGPLPPQALASIWTEIIAACRGLERELTVAFLGPQGSFSEQAALQQFGSVVQQLPCPSLDEVFRAVEAGQADVGIVPVENSTEGAVNRCLDLFLNTPLKILAEHSLGVHHCLMSRLGSMGGVKTLAAHPQALAQCQGWIGRHYPNLAQIAAASNSDAARMAAADPTVAAIAGEVAAIAWALQVVAPNIQDDPQNRTRFYAIGNIETRPTGQDKTSLIVAVPNRAGAVYRMLAPLADNGVSMTRLESRPARTGQWEYYFYVDILGHCQDVAVERALAGLRAQTAFCKLLGSYPAQ